MKVLMVSTAFMKGHPRHMQATGFPGLILDGTKIHTIRANSKGFFKEGDRVGLRVWSGMPYRSKQVEFLQCTIGIEPVRIVYAPGGLDVFCGKRQVWLADLARNDGLDMNDFIHWFFTPLRFETFRGNIIHFTDFRYATEAR